MLPATEARPDLADATGVRRSGNPLLTVAEFDACHLPPWTEREMLLFQQREAQLRSQGQSAIEAERNAEVLVLRDREAVGGKG